MDPADYLALAQQLINQDNEASHRSAVSRAYYGLFNYLHQEISRMGFALRREGTIHDEIYRLLHNCGVEEVRCNAVLLRQLREGRNKADYFYLLPFLPSVEAIQHCQSAKMLLAFFKQQFADAAAREKIRTGIKDYRERLRSEH
jgi:hypothetical protein